MSKQKSNNKFGLGSSTFERKSNNRTEKSVAEEKPLMLFSFKDFQYNQQIPPGQTYENWQEEKLLAYMLDVFGYICNVNRIEAEQQKFIKVYGNFPANSEFKNPFPNSDLDWGVIMRVKGQAERVAGYFKENVFYVVFLDVNHRFFPSNK